jgi:hypothetical protein
MAHPMAETIVELAEMKLKEEKKNKAVNAKRNFLERLKSNAFLILCEHKVGNEITTWAFYVFVDIYDIYVEGYSIKGEPKAVIKIEKVDDLDDYIDGKLNVYETVYGDDYDDDSTSDISLYSIEFGDFDTECPNPDCEKKIYKRFYVYNKILTGFETIRTHVKDMIIMAKNMTKF